jgi:hypothetical protein
LDNVTACLLSWRRPRNLRTIVADVGRHPFIDEILIWSNDASVEIQLEDPRVRVLKSPENVGCYGRFLCVAQARNPVVYVQDDDALLGNLDELAGAFAADPTRIAHALRPGHYADRHLRVHGDCEVALLGWGAFLMRDWVCALDVVPDSMRAGELFRREADKFFSLLLERRHTAILGEIRLLDGHSQPGLALWLEPEHWRMGARAVREALRLVRERRSPEAPAPWHVIVTGAGSDSVLQEAVASVTGNAADYELTVLSDASGLNHAIASVVSEFVTHLEAHDRFGPYYLREAGAVLADGADVANPDAILVGPPAGRWSAPATVDLDGLQAHNSIHYSAAFRRSGWARVGGFDETIDHGRHHDFWIRMVRAGARVRRVVGDHFFHRRTAADVSG